MTKAEFDELQRLAKVGERTKQKAWIVIKLLDYRLQALAPELEGDDEGHVKGFSPIGSNTGVYLDREVAFQAARTHNGLLCAVSGLPDGKAAQAVHDNAAAIVARTGAKGDDGEGRPY